MVERFWIPVAFVGENLIQALELRALTQTDEPCPGVILNRHRQLDDFDEGLFGETLLG